MTESGNANKKEVEKRQTSSNTPKGKNIDIKQVNKSTKDVQSFSITVPYIWR